MSLSTLRDQFYPIFCHIAYWYQFYHDDVLTRLMVRAFVSTLLTIDKTLPDAIDETLLGAIEKLVNEVYDDIIANSDKYCNEISDISEFAEIPKSTLTDKELGRKIDTCFLSFHGNIESARSKSTNPAIDDEPIKIMLETVLLIGVLKPEYGIYIQRPSEYMKKYFSKYYGIVCPRTTEQSTEQKIRHEVDGVVFYTIAH